MRRPQLRSTFARATVPVAAGIGFFGLLALALWGVAALISSNSDQTTQNLSKSVQEMGSTSVLASIIDKDGPIVLQDLIGNDDHIVLDHVGNDPNSDWSIYLAHPADRDARCTIEVVKGTHTFTDCEQRTLTVDELALPPAGVAPIVNKDGTLTLDLTPDEPVAGTSAPATT